MTVILDAFKDSGHVFAEGFKVNGEKFTVINVTDRSLWAKKACLGSPCTTLTVIQANFGMALQGKEGLIIVKTTQALLLAHHPEVVTTQSCVSTVEALGDYLISVGY
jgi:profilin